MPAAPRPAPTAGSGGGVRNRSARQAPNRGSVTPRKPPCVCNPVAGVCVCVSLTVPVVSSLQCAALVGEDQPLCPDLPELDLSELDVSDLDADSFLGGLKWYSDQSEIISAQYGNEASNLFEVSHRGVFHSVPKQQRTRSLQNTALTYKRWR